MVPAEPASDVSKLQVNEIIQQIRSSRQKEKFERLFDGDIQGYASASEADLALCSILSFWTNKTPWINRLDFPSIQPLQAEMGRKALQ